LRRSHTQTVHDQPQRTLVLIEGGGPISGFNRRTGNHPLDLTAAVRVAVALIEHDDQRSASTRLKRWLGEYRVNIGL